MNRGSERSGSRMGFTLRCVDALVKVFLRTFVKEVAPHQVAWARPVASSSPGARRARLRVIRCTCGIGRHGQFQLDVNPYAPVTDSNNIWMNEIPNANYFHVYEVQVTYDVVSSLVCTYAGQNSISWCQ